MMAGNGQEVTNPCVPVSGLDQRRKTPSSPPLTTSGVPLPSRSAEATVVKEMAEVTTSVLLTDHELAKGDVGFCHKRN